MADTPMMEQYRRAKSKNRDAVLFFRLGDFYEMFFEDAIEVSSLLNLTLTKRQGEPMCGIPWHASRSYIARLLRAGKKVAICEQVGEVGAGKGIVEREVIEVITPGTAMEEDFLDRSANNWLLALCAEGGRLGAAWLDLGTAEFRCLAIPEGDEDLLESWLTQELYRLDPREVLVQQSLLSRKGVGQALSSRPALILNRLPDWSFDTKAAAGTLKARLGLSTLKGLGFSREGVELAAAAALLRYVDEMAKAAAPHIRVLLPWEPADHALIDESTQKNLELVRNLQDSSRSFSLLEAVDFTRTGPGARLLRQWLLEPLSKRGPIEARLDAVEFLHRRQKLLAALRGLLGRVLDSERLASRVAMGKAHAKDLLALRDSLAASLEASREVEEGGGLAVLEGVAAAGPRGGEGEALVAVIADISRTVKEEPSILLTEGNLIRGGVDAELDRLHALRDDARTLLEAYLEEEKAGTGIANLRVRFNRVIGYYLEVSKGRLDAVPAHFMRRQSLVNGERYSTIRLAELEAEINGAHERIVELEKRLFLELRDRMAAAVPVVLSLARSTAVLDCLASFAWAATAKAWVRPVLRDDTLLRIVEGRHPVVEAHLPAGTFVPNGLRLSAEGEGRASASSSANAGVPSSVANAGVPSSVANAGVPSFALITGPNMAGKSTFLRQTALIVIMAQSGCYVPAEEAEIGLADRIFCRVGAHDDLARGESTFLVEMHETARILNTATARSLVIMDEVGRGTSTIDGLSIAWAVTERLLDGIGARTLFATHYHELTALAHPRLENLSLAVLEEEGEVIFLKHIEAGAARGSYGLHVARLAGIPEEVLARARIIRAGLSAREDELAATRGGATARPPAPPPPQPGLFDPRELVLDELASLDLDRLSPLEALNRLAKLKASLKKN